MPRNRKRGGKPRARTLQRALKHQQQQLQSIKMQTASSGLGNPSTAQVKQEEPSKACASTNKQTTNNPPVGLPGPPALGSVWSASNVEAMDTSESNQNNTTPDITISPRMDFPQGTDPVACLRCQRKLVQPSWANLKEHLKKCNTHFLCCEKSCKFNTKHWKNMQIHLEMNHSKTCEYYVQAIKKIATKFIPADTEQPVVKDEAPVVKTTKASFSVTDVKQESKNTGGAPPVITTNSSSIVTAGKPQPQIPGVAPAVKTTKSSTITEVKPHPQNTGGAPAVVTTNKSLLLTEVKHLPKSPKTTKGTPAFDTTNKSSTVKKGKPQPQSTGAQVTKTGQTLPIAKTLIICNVPSSVNRIELTRFFPSAKISLIPPEASKNSSSETGVALLEFSSRNEMLWYLNKNQNAVKLGQTEFSLQDMLNCTEHQEMFGSCICSCGKSLIRDSPVNPVTCPWCSEHGAIKCLVSKCLFRCEYTLELTEHLREDHTVTGDGDSFFLCPFSNCKTMISKDGLKGELGEHLNSAHSAVKGVGKQVECPLCRCRLLFEESGKDWISEHLRLRHTEADFKRYSIFLCPLDGIPFSSPDQLVGHLTAQHTAYDILFECPVDVCPYLFEEGKLVLRHLEEFHAQGGKKSPVIPVLLVMKQKAGMLLKRQMVRSAVDELVALRRHLADNWETFSLQQRCEAIKEVQFKEHRLKVDAKMKRNLAPKKLEQYGNPTLWQLEFMNQQLSKAEDKTDLASQPVDQLLQLFTLSQNKQVPTPSTSGSSESPVKPKKDAGLISDDTLSQLQPIQAALDSLDMTKSPGVPELAKFEVLIELSKLVLRQRGFKNSEIPGPVRTDASLEAYLMTPSHRNNPQDNLESYQTKSSSNPQQLGLASTPMETQDYPSYPSQKLDMTPGVNTHTHNIPIASRRPCYNQQNRAGWSETPRQARPYGYDYGYVVNPNAQFQGRMQMQNLAGSSQYDNAGGNQEYPHYQGQGYT